MFLVLLLYALFGLTFTLGKITLFYASPFFIVGLRMLIGGIGLMSYIYLTKRVHCYPVRSDIFYYALATIFGIIIPYCSRAWALQYMTTTKTALLFNFMPFFTAIFAYIFFKEKLTWRKLLGLTIGFLGMIPILVTSSPLEDIFGTIGFISLPEIVTLVAVASFAYQLIVMQKLVKHRGCAPILANGMSMLWGGLFSFSMSMFFETTVIRGNVLIFAGLLLLQVVISNLLCANLQASLLKQYSPTFMSLAGFITPLSAAFYGWILLGETISWHFFASLIIVMIGLAIYYYDDFKKNKKLNVQF